MKTFSQKPADVTRQWVVIDASEGTLGRVATVAANRLIGKYKPTYTAHVDGGDHVIIINARAVGVTGNKLDGKKYYRHSGFPGGITETTLGELLVKDPTAPLVNAIKGMLPKNKLQPARLERLRVFADAEHNHEAQKPQKIGVE